jgi:hypothetical protein
MTRHDPRDVTRENANDPTRQPGSKDMASWKPGSESADAKNVAGKGDFGVPVGSGPSRERDYVTENTRMSDPGAAKPRSGEVDGVRTTGVGAAAEGDGSGSEGDIDTDFIGVGTGGTGVAATGPGDTSGADDSDGTSDEFASGGHAQGLNAIPRGHIGGDKRVRGTVVGSGYDMQTNPRGYGADVANNPGAQGDDAFAGEVSSGEAAGDDLSMSPSQDTQGAVEGDNQTGGGQKDFPDQGN